MAIDTEEQKERHRQSRKEHQERTTANIGEDGKTEWQRRWEREFAHRWVMTSTGLRLRSEVEKERAR